MTAEYPSLADATIDLRHVRFDPAPGLPPQARDSVLRSLRSKHVKPNDSPGREEDLRLDEEDRLFVSRVLGEVGLSAGDYREASLKRRIPACLRALRAGTVVEAMRWMDQHAGARATALNALLIGVTRFYRSGPVFDQLRSTVLPELLGRVARPAICSLGCSDGAELYSVAMLLSEMGHLHRCELVGRDVRAAALERAVDGLFEVRDAVELPAALCRRYLVGERGGLRVSANLRKAVRWEQADALTESEPDRWDLALCRNMVIYMNAEAAMMLWTRIERALRPGGWLVVGRAERPAGAARLRRVGPCLYQREEGGRDGAWNRVAFAGV